MGGAVTGIPNEAKPENGRQWPNSLKTTAFIRKKARAELWYLFNNWVF
jgi:hypothetical protein